MGRVVIPPMIEPKIEVPDQVNHQKRVWGIVISGVSLGIGGAAIVAEATHFHG